MANEKILLVILDGLGDRPSNALSGQTPLESARTTSFSALLEKGACGLMDPIGVGIRPASDVAHLSILGYDISKDYTNRGPFEALGVGLQLKEGDVCLRTNLGTVDSTLKVLDRRAGRISDCSGFEKDLNTTIDGIKIIFKAGFEHRAAVVLRGQGLSPEITELDSHIVGRRVQEAKPKDSTVEAKKTADVLNKYATYAYNVLKKHPINKQRKKQKQPIANYLLLRGAGNPPSLLSFKEKYGLNAACVAAGGLYKGVARAAGMELIHVQGATEKSDTDLVAKAVAARKSLQTFDFVFLHIKAADNFGHDGDAVGKRNFLERVDSALKEITGLSRTLVVVTGDHSTPCTLKNHSGDPVPILFSGDMVRKDAVKKFGERECAKGGAGRIQGKDVMNEIMNLTGRAPLHGT